MPSLPPVPELDNQLKRTTRITGGLMTLVLLAIAANPGDSLAWGLFLGLATGLYNTISLALRIKRLGSQDRSGARSYMRQGLIMRLALVAVVVLLAGRVAHVNVYWLGAGLLAVPCITAVDAALRAARLSRSEGGVFSKVEEKI
ncbi:ATP synthase subunit I [Desulfofundulus thermosubterraneus]|uniref:ATP synthase I chain n=1 Tax=Desulfofundulus thermosubterraneus DSM 16057 TaxID=1121432 RepID=A0A1M6HNQ3_9FIRM|nr:ATP synthase subunit I [Desulfofundulus thermosubterraneus]SHJ23756.1 ATP synthase I chain [Desulfofundulus thermosubterraneus DSM 16057]